MLTDLSVYAFKMKRRSGGVAGPLEAGRLRRPVKRSPKMAESFFGRSVPRHEPTNQPTNQSRERGPGPAMHLPGDPSHPGPIPHLGTGQSTEGLKY